MISHAAWRVHGRVQGVGFRWSTVREARSLGIEGRVWNRSDGAVEVHARGSTTMLEALAEWLRVGPAGARVDTLERVPVGPEADREGFQVLRGSDATER